MLKDIGGKIYCSIVCVKSLAEQVRKCCLLPRVSFQRIFLSESRSDRYNATKVWGGIQGGRRPPAHLSSMPATLRWLRVTLPRRTRTPRQKGLATPALALACGKAFPLCFSLHRRETHRLPTWEQPHLFLQFKTLLPVFAVVLENTAMCIYPDQEWLQLFKLLAFW